MSNIEKMKNHFNFGVKIFGNTVYDLSKSQGFLRSPYGKHKRNGGGQVGGVDKDYQGTTVFRRGRCRLVVRAITKNNKN